MKYALRLFAILLLAAVLAPAGVLAKDEAKKPAPPNAWKVIEGQKDLSKFAGLVDDAGLQGMFENKDGTVTVFAPSNDALEKVSSDVMKKIKSDKTHLQAFVKYHVITGSVVSSSNMRGRKAGPGTASGETLMFDGTGKVTKINNAEFVTPDLAAGNGVVHVVNAALVPPSFTEKKEEKGKEPAAMKEMEEMKAKLKAKAVPETSPTAAPSEEKTETAAPSVPASPTPPPAAAPAPKKEGGLKGLFKKFGW